MAQSDSLTTTAKLKALGLHSYEVRVQSYNFPKGNRTYKAYSEDDAYALTLALRDAGRALHGETFDRDGDLDETVEWENAQWHVECWDMYPEDDEGKVSSKPKRMFGHRHGAYIMADPRSKVFVWAGGSDCDGYDYHSTGQFETLLEAHEWLEEVANGAEGPWGWGIITRDDYETVR